MSGTILAAFLFAVLGWMCISGSRRMTGADAAAYAMLGFASIVVFIALLAVAALRYLWGA